MKNKLVTYQYQPSPNKYPVIKMELVIHPNNHPPFKVLGAYTAYQVFKANWSNKINYQMEVYLMHLDRGLNLKGVELIQSGGIDTMKIDTRLVFNRLLITGSMRFMIAYNRPAGNLNVGRSYEVVHRIKRQANFLDLELVDALIISSSDYYSYSDNGYLK